MNYIKVKGIPNEERSYYEYQWKISSRENIQRIIANITPLPEEIKAKIRLKDTIRKMVKE